MRIRTITVGAWIDPGKVDDSILHIGDFLRRARSSFEEFGIGVQTVRLSTQPFGEFGLTGEDLMESIVQIESISRRAGIDFISVGPARTEETIDLIPNIIDRTEVTCASAWAGDVSSGMKTENINGAARACLRISELDGVGLKNFSFTTIANCPPDIPFFPASYHVDKSPVFTIGMESGDLLYESFKDGGTLEEAGRRLKELYKIKLGPVEKKALEISGVNEIQYGGIDPSTAPSLEERGSVADAIAFLLDGPFTSPGTLSACEMITSVLRSLDIKRCGYSGIMLPVMEDLGLARSSDENLLTIPDLLSYSSVCGTGLDTIPIPGDTPVKRIENTIMDVVTLSLKLKKPLSARLLPMVGIKKGERTDVRSPYLVNCRVLPI